MTIPLALERASSTPPSDADGAVLEQIAALACASVRAPLTGDVRHAARRCVIDWLGVAIAGWNEAPSRKLRAALGIEADARFGAALDGAIAPDHAALLLGTASHALDYDDTDYVNLIHVSSTLLPALFALARERRVDGATLLATFNAGYEAEDRLGGELGRKLTACGWHVSGVIGRFGSALASGLMLQLEPPALAHAMAIAATASSGLIGAFGTMSKPLQLARGAADGLVAARLAAEGFTGPLRLLESNPGFTRPFVGEPLSDWSSLARDWGQPYAVLRNAFKPHASCMITHPVVDAATALREHVSDPTVIDRVICRVNPLAPKVAGHALPSTGFEGKFSVAYCCVVGLLLGHATPVAFDPATLARGDVQALLRKVDVVTDAAIGEQQAHVDVRLTDGRTLREQVAMARGNPANPMTDAELDRKFLLLTRAALGGHSERALEQLRAFDRVPDVGAFLRTLES